jgi:type VI secretion system secreted protein VgrG
MNRTLLSLALSAAFAAAPAQAGPLEDRIDLLSRQVQELQGQISQLRSMLSRDGTGNVTFTATANRKDIVGRDFSTSVGGNASSSYGRSLSLAVVQSRSTEIGVDDLLTVTGSSKNNVGGTWRLNVSGDAIQQVSKNLSTSVAREILIQAGDQILLKAGDSSILMNKDGTITISGNLVDVKASGDVLIKGSRILKN